MIKYFDGTVFEANAEAIVNAVNCVGVMGAGIAKEFKKRYPAYFADYQAKCKQGKINTGEVDYFSHPKTPIIVSFPTKSHYRYDSRIEWIEQGLRHFLATHKNHGINSAAFPKLGSGSGKLEWDEVQELMEKYLSNTDTEIIICLNEKSTQISLF